MIFSTIFRRLRSFRVRPLKPALVASSRLSGLDAPAPTDFYHVATFESISAKSMNASTYPRLRSFSHQDGTDDFPERRLPPSVLTTVINTVQNIHLSDSRPARARRQPQTVLEPHGKRQRIRLIGQLV